MGGSASGVIERSQTVNSPDCPAMGIDSLPLRRYFISTAMVGEMDVRGVVKKWGNSAAVRIPASVLEAAHVHLDQSVDVRVEEGRIVIEPLRPAGHDLAGLVAGITDENRHEPIETGVPVGREAW